LIIQTVLLTDSPVIISSTNLDAHPCL